MWTSIGLPSTMDMYDTHEMFSRYPVDPVLAQRVVPEPWRVKVHDDGRAVLLVMVQDCRRMVLDAIIPLGRVRFSHVWIEVEGPDELVDPLPGTSRALRTWYWYILPHQSDRRLVRTLFGVAGAPAQLVESVELGTRIGRSRSGAVRESASDGYRWTETADLYDSPDIVTGSHRFYRRYGKLESEAHARCFTHFLGDGTVELEASPGSSVASLGFGTSLRGSSNPVWFRHCHVTYRVRLARSPARTAPDAGAKPRQDAFIAEPRRVNPALRPWHRLVDHLMQAPFLPARLMAWDPRTSFSWFAGSLYWLFPVGRARKTLGDRIQTIVAITAAYTTESPYCIADTVGEPTGLTSAEIEAIRTAADPDDVATFTPRERLAIRYARLISATPLRFPPEFVTDLTAAFTEQEIVILAALAAEVNRNARLFEALGAPPPDLAPAHEST